MRTKGAAMGGGAAEEPIGTGVDEGAATAAFVAVLRTAETALRAVPSGLESARVHDFAFGKLFEATEVRDAYHSRLPETENDIAEACDVLGHFVGGLTGGHAIRDREGAPPPSPTARKWSAQTFPWRRTPPQRTDERSAADPWPTGGEAQP